MDSIESFSITVTYFEVSGDYFMKDEIYIPVSLVNIMEDGERHLRIRKYIKENYTNNEFILIITDDGYDNNMIGTPIMLFPK